MATVSKTTKEIPNLTKTTEFQRIAKDTTKAIYDAGRRSAVPGGREGLDASEALMLAAMERVLRLVQNQGILMTPDVVVVKASLAPQPPREDPKTEPMHELRRP